jgi:ACS family pantothenate transporter-like MFS transporter
MSQPQEKAIKNAFAATENVAVVAAPESDGDVSSYKESKRTWKSVIWSCKSQVHHYHKRYHDTDGRAALDVPPDEARFLTKLDLTLISTSALGVMCRYLDQVNINNAFSEWQILRPTPRRTR